MCDSVAPESDLETEAILVTCELGELPDVPSSEFVKRLELGPCDVLRSFSLRIRV